MKSELLLDKFEVLPENMRLQVLDFVDFLYDKYVDDNLDGNEDEKVELSDELKAFLDARIASMRENPEKNITFEESIERINKKYGWSE